MKKALLFLAAIAALALTAIVSTSCDKHAYSISTNHFAYQDGSKIKEIGNNFSISKGSTTDIFAVYDNDTRIIDPHGVYSARSDNESIAKVYVVDEAECIKLEGVSKGTTKVSFNYEVYGFKLYKTVTITVK